MENITPIELKVELGQTFSQWTYTLYTNGSWDKQLWFTDGTHTTETGSIGRPAQKGDLKHTEYVWRNNAWLQTVVQYY